ncbi:MAG: hypothetical protein ACLR5F_02405, partial [Faecalibacterium sp.]
METTAVVSKPFFTERVPKIKCIVTTKNAVYGHDLSREKANQQSPQALLVCKYKNNTSAGNGQSEAEAILNQKSKIRFFPRLKDRHLHWGVEPVLPAFHDRQMRPAFLTEALDHGA